VIDDAINTLAPVVGRKRACTVLGRSRATHYRRLRPNRPHPHPTGGTAEGSAGHTEPGSGGDRRGDGRSCPPRALSDNERARVVELLDSDRFCDVAPTQAWARLLDEGTYLCSIPTMYRLLRARAQVRERRRQARHPATVKPELVATAPRQVWSWDITKLLGPFKWTWYYLYVILDVFSRYAVGWAVAARETARLAEALIAECLRVEGIERDQLTIHADRGSSMTSKPVAHLLADLGVTRSHSRPHVSNDNPFSESQFKTLKYFPAFPERFTGLEHARGFSDGFFHHYNHLHHHSGLALLTPADVHHGRADTIIAARQAVLDDFYTGHPERFRKPPLAPQLPAAVWINKPEEATTRT
jgi:putative transposase